MKRFVVLGILVILSLMLTGFSFHPHAELAISGNEVTFTGQWVMATDLLVRYCDGTEDFLQFRHWVFPPHTWEFDQPVAYADSLVWFLGDGIRLVIAPEQSCEDPHGPVVVPMMYTYVNPTYTAPDGVEVLGVTPFDMCFILSDNGLPSTESRVRNCDNRWPSGPRPGWSDTMTLLTQGEVRYDGTNWGWYRGDWAIEHFSYQGYDPAGYNPRLPLYGEGTKGLFSVWCEYTAGYTGELPGTCLP